VLRRGKLSEQTNDLNTQETVNINRYFTKSLKVYISHTSVCGGASSEKSSVYFLWKENHQNLFSSPSNCHFCISISSSIL